MVDSEYINRCLDEIKGHEIVRDDRQRAKELEKSIDELESDFNRVICRAISDYNETQNPLYIWEMYLMHRELGKAVPERIMQYFDECAYKLLDKAYGSVLLKDAIRKQGFKKGVDGGVVSYEALGLSRTKGAYNAFIGLQRREAFNLLMYDIEQLEKLYLSQGEEEVTARVRAVKEVHQKQESEFDEDSISENTLYKHYKEYKEQSN